MTIRELPADEYHRLRTVPPFDHLAADVLPSPTLRIIVAESPAGEIVAHWTAFNVVHCEPLWIREDHRGNAGLGRGLVEGMQGVLDQDGVRVAYAIIADADVAQMAPMAARLGFVELPGALYVLDRGLPVKEGS